MTFRGCVVLVVAALWLGVVPSLFVPFVAVVLGVVVLRRMASHPSD